MSLLLWVGCGVLLCGGLAAVVAWYRGSERPEVEENARPRRFVPESVRRRRQLQATVSVVGVVLGWLLTGYAVVVVVVPVLVFGLPWLISATVSQKAGIERLEAFGEWTQRLSDVLLLGVGLEQAVIGSLRTAPTALEEDLTDLVGRIQARMDLVEALRRFGDRLGDATSDKVLAALLLRANDTGPGLARALTDMADSIREEVRQRRLIEADRAKHRATVRWLVLILMAAVGLLSLNGSYLQPYRTPVGQLVFAAVVCAVVAVVGWMARMAAHRPVPRFLEVDRQVRAGAQDRDLAPEEEEVR